MKIRKELFAFYINSSIHVALAVVSLCWITFLHFDFAPDFLLLSFVFFATITGYNFVKYAGVAKLHHRSLATGLRKIQIFSLLAFLFLLYFTFLVDRKILLWTSIFGLLTLLYALPVFGQRRNLRSISGMKIFIIAIVWGGVTVVLPVIEKEEVLFGSVILEFLQRFLLVLAWIIPFEIRDLKYDLQQLGTLPQRVGVTKTKVFGLALLVAAVLLEILKSHTAIPSFMATTLIAGVSAGSILRAKERQTAYFSSFWVEAIPIIWLLVLLLIRSL